MKLWDRFNKLFKTIIFKKQKQDKYIHNTENTFHEDLTVSPECLAHAKTEQNKEQLRNFQIMFALKNICEQKLNLYDTDITKSLQNLLSKYGYSSDLQLDDLDIEILSRANWNLNIKPSKVLTEYINNSSIAANEVKKLIDTIRKEAVDNAKSFQCPEKEAVRFLPSNVVAKFEQVIQEEQNKSREDRE